METHSAPVPSPSSRLVLIVIIGIVTAFVACGGGGGGATTVPVQPPVQPPPTSSNILAINANHIVYDTLRERIYASVSKDDTARPNTVAVIDPATMKVESTISVGTDPDQLALSSDFAYLYVGVNGTGEVARVVLSSKTVDIRVSLGVDSTWGFRRVAGDIAVVPGRPRSFVVARKLPAVSPPYDGVVAFDDEVKRPVELGKYQPGYNADEIEFSDSGDYLYALETSVSSFDFMRLRLDVDGLHYVDEASQLLGWGYVNHLAQRGGRVYSTLGTVADPSSFTVLGDFLTTSGMFATSVVPDPDSKTVYFTTYGGSDQIVAFDTETYLAKGSVKLDRGAFDLVKCGSRGFAYIGATTRGERSVVLETRSILPAATTAPTLDTVVINSMVYDPGTQKLYASVPSRAGANGNSVAVINPVASTIERFIAVGSEPNQLAVSDDSKYLYVALDGAGAVRRVSLTTLQPEIQFSLGLDNSMGPLSALQIAVMPGHPQTLVASLRTIANYSPFEYGIVAFDDGVRRPDMARISAYDGPIAFTEDPATLLGPSGTSGLVRFSVDATGVHRVSATPGLFGAVKQFRYVSGRIYSDSGLVANTATTTLAGTYPVPSVSTPVVDVPANTVYFLGQPAAGTQAVLAFDATHFRFLGYKLLDKRYLETKTFTSAGGNRLAYAKYDGGIVITTNDVTPAAEIGPSAKDLPVNRMVFDEARNRIYASVPGSAGRLGNTVVAIDPVTTNIVASVEVGSEPGPLTLSRDGQVLYVGLDGSGEVVRLDAAGLAFNDKFRLKMDHDGPHFAYSMAPVPGSNDQLVVSERRWGWSPAASAVALYASGIRMPDATGDNLTIDSITFGDSVNELYGTNSEDTSFAFHKLRVSATGVTDADQYGSLVSGFNHEIRFSNGLIYSTVGTIFDPVVPSLIASLPIDLQGVAITPDPQRGEIFFATWSPANRTEIRRYDQKTFVLLGTTKHDDASSPGRDLIRYGTNGLAYATGDGHIVFTTFTTTAPQPLSLDKLPAKTLLYDRVRQRIYATIPSSGGAHGNSVAIIDPVTKTAETYIAVGSQPGPMAMSSDGNYLYVGLTGGGSVVRIDLTARVVDKTLTLGAKPGYAGGAMWPDSIAVMPQDSETVAIGREYFNSTMGAGVAIFQRGVQLANEFDDRTRIWPTAFANSSTLYACGMYGDFYTIGVNSSGAFLQDSKRNVFLYPPERCAFDDGRIYSTAGDIYDPVAGAVTARFKFTGWAPVVLPDANGRVYFMLLDPNTSNTSIHIFDKTSQQELKQVTLPLGVIGRDIARWGSNGIVVATDSGFIFSSDPN